ncbi:MAG: GNAT family N-acetyltransferase [Firmicutes bacterium]|nr:GNAT family N-acetyltransferase [Bacillota bacterium]HOB35068.1 GNAT family N-acetyltransferase [Bacillota bacterium]HPZ91418.1 GNAT family N-acetyltransferase [Bacillota bacterium]HQE01268.1 GNAT family N-acetyltransferase [Bacillota bacterium]
MPHIRTLQPDDYKHLLAIEAECFDSGYSPYFIKMIPVLFGSTSFIAVKGKSPQGYVAAALEQANPRRAWILSLAVRPKYREQGLGQSLLRHALDALAQAGAAEVFLTVAPDNKPALALYQNMGFSPEKHCANYFGPGENRILLKKNLVRENI